MHAAPVEAPAVDAQDWNDESPFPPPAGAKRGSPRAARKSTARKAEPVVEAVPEPAPMLSEQAEATDAPTPMAGRKPAARSRRPAKPKAAPENI